MFSFRWRPVPARVATARGLIRDPDGRWLIVRPVGKRHWQLPGGRLERGEPPTAACRRELREELGVDLEPGRPLAVTWRPARRRSARFAFVFDMGTHDALEIRLQAAELSEWRWATPEEALPLLKPDMAAALTSGADQATAVYLEF
ncbi:NUDIX domain-containing protein [Actinophytocola oryzae]|uniref:ADP-ribose pyrophosphatase YjhB (NUDIX family) n=1 Tax=Actinophytocola oryzae TaxID=502181 RepID=A0A4R7W268_9PSEU|nr:NUDIX hydrolase [Actinophytocola oryzae]TDV56594.1 ADP-ribose pyrophosphatase YjhB (NUDIX family) [Actinophytocola oryzae]